MKNLFLAVSLLFIGAFCVIGTVNSERVYGYNPLDSACTDDVRGISPNCPATTTKNPLTGPDGILMKITRIIAIIAGVSAILVIIISGIKYMLAGGDAKKASEARNGLIGALIGLVIISLAGLIIMFVVTRI